MFLFQAPQDSPKPIGVSFPSDKSPVQNPQSSPKERGEKLSYRNSMISEGQNSEDVQIQLFRNVANQTFTKMHLKKRKTMPRKRQRNKN